MFDLLNEYRFFVFRGLVESILLAYLSVLFFKYTNFKEIIDRNFKKYFIYIFFSALVLVQIVDRFQQFYPQNFDYYPFARFSMYQAAPNDVKTEGYRFCYYETGNNECNEINITKNFSTIGLPSISSRMKYLIDNIPNTNYEIELWLKSFESSLGEIEINRLTFEKLIYKDNKINYEILKVLDVKN